MWCEFWNKRPIFAHKIFIMIEQEIWKEIPGYSNYEVSTLGGIRSKDRPWIKGRSNTKGRVLKGTISDKGYHVVYISSEKGEGRVIGVHRLVMLTFAPIDLCQSLHVNHINAIKTDNRLSNLEWVTLQENIKHAVGLGLFAKGERIAKSKLTEEKVDIIRRLYAEGVTNCAIIAKAFNVTTGTIDAVIKGRTWKV